MAGRYGAERVTTRNLEVVAVRPEEHLLLVRGAVPGARNGIGRRAQAGRRRRSASAWRSEHGDAAGRVADARAGRRASTVPAALVAGPGARAPPVRDGAEPARVAARRARAATKTRALRQRRRQEAVEAEGHRPRARRAASARRCGRGGAVIFGPQPRDYSLPAAALGARAPRCAPRWRPATREGKLARRRRARARRAEDEAHGRVPGGPRARRAACSSCSRARDEARRARGAQPAAREGARSAAGSTSTTSSATRTSS